ncbi:MAG: PQQ-binding-like beta-propeller repeat protein [Nitrososphaerota archaeon]|nr:PQQ-binding-like beta-propeller repeat protein [Nitrososphaerota archaeon]
MFNQNRPPFHQPTCFSTVRWVSSFTSDNDRIYFGVGDGNVYALDADSGKKIWNYTYTLPDASGVYIPSSPILEMGLST